MQSNTRVCSDQLVKDLIGIQYLDHYIRDPKIDELYFSHMTDSGFDLCAAVWDPVAIMPGKIAIIPNGIKVKLLQGYELQIRSRSGLATKGVVVLNSPGTVDNGYMGELKTILINHGNSTHHVHRGDRIAQAVPVLLTSVSLYTMTVEYDSIEKTERGEGGFGSTGR